MRGPTRPPLGVVRPNPPFAKKKKEKNGGGEEGENVSIKSIKVEKRVAGVLKKKRGLGTIKTKAPRRRRGVHMGGLGKDKRLLFRRVGGRRESQLISCRKKEDWAWEKGGNVSVIGSDCKLLRWNGGGRHAH